MEVGVETDDENGGHDDEAAEGGAEGNLAQEVVGGTVLRLEALLRNHGEADQDPAGRKDPQGDHDEPGQAQGQDLEETTISDS